MYIQVNDDQLHYVVDGRGVPCMISAMTGSPFYERTFSRHLRHSLQCVFVEPRGSGRSEGEVDAVTFETIAADMDALRQALGIQQMLVLGQSANGLMALAYARAYPAQTLGVVLVGSPPASTWDEATATFRATYMTPERRKIWQERRELLTPETLQALSPGEAIRAQLIANAPLYWYDPAFEESSLHEGGVIKPAFLQQFGTLRRQAYDPERWFKEISCPVFIAHGAYDFCVPPTLWEGKVAHFPHATFRLFQHSAHYPQYEEQAAFDEALLAWLAQL